MQLALDNALAPFFENNFGFGITKAANLAAIFGMMNFFSRPLSGLFSDLIARRYGMRGRIWWLWFVVAAGGEPSCPQKQPSHELHGVLCQATGFKAVLRVWQGLSLSCRRHHSPDWCHA